LPPEIPFYLRLHTHIFLKTIVALQRT